MTINLDNIPQKPGVYKYKDVWGNIIYVGASKNLKKRISSYFQKKHDHPRLKKLVENIDNVEYEIIDNINDVFIRERQLIGIHRPKYNVQWLDDKQYPFLMITDSEEFPRLQIVRERQNDDNLYFGRQTRVKILRNSLREIRKVFPVCDCRSPVIPSKKVRPCLNYDLGLCSAPCAQKIKTEQYRLIIQNLTKFLSGDSKELINYWEDEMKNAADNENFEYAAKLRDRIKIINQLAKPEKEETDYHFDVIGVKLTETTGVVVRLTISHEQIVDTQEFIILDSFKEDKENILFESLKQIYQDEEEFPPLIILPGSIEEQELLFDWFTYRTQGKIKFQIFSNPKDYKWTRIAEETAQKSLQRHFGKKTQTPHTLANYDKIRQRLANLLNCDPDIHWIECIDISTLQGTATVASIVSFFDGTPDKSNYRKFTIKGLDHPDDHYSMKQTLTRHFGRKLRENSPLPDLIILDGGQMQLAAARSTFNALSIKIPYFGIAKKHEELVIPNKSETVKLELTDPLLQLVIALRDEAHRFAITFNRKTREKLTITSELDNIAGIGKTRKKLLLKHFTSVERIKTASKDEILLVPHLPKSVAEKVYSYFHNR